MSDAAEWLDILGDEFDVRVTPKASRNALKLEYDEQGAAYLRAYVTIVPEKGKANQAVIKLLSKELKLSKSSFTIIRGEVSRNKRIKLSG